MEALDFIDELRSIICPIDSNGPSKLGKYYTYKNGKRYDFDSYEEAFFLAKTTGCQIWAYRK